MAEPDDDKSRFDVRVLPMAAMILSALLVLLSFPVGWYSIDVDVQTWEFDDTKPQNKGDPLGTFKLDLEMTMLNLETHFLPNALENKIKANQGLPTYDEHAGRIGTIMLGILILQASVLLTLVSVIVFKAVDRKTHRERSTIMALSVVLVVLSLFVLVYFAAAIGGAAQKDVQYLVTKYRFDDQAGYNLNEIKVGFWQDWKTDRPQNVPVSGSLQVWEVQAQSRPSAGWWLLSASTLVFFVGAAIYTRQASSDPLVGPAGESGDAQGAQ
jgi:hypothetical protein